MTDMNAYANMKQEIPSYKTRFIREYQELKDRYEKLRWIIVRMEAGTLDFKPSCSMKLLRKQAKAMSRYLYLLEVRSQIEGINVDETTVAVIHNETISTPKACFDNEGNITLL